MINIVNGYKTGWQGVYIGRPGKGKDSPLGNPFDLEKYSREESIARFREWLWEKLNSADSNEQKAEITRLANIYVQGGNLQLDCFCKPKACHGDVIKSAIIWWATNRINYYAGVGSRETPPNICQKMTSMAEELDKSGWILRSGGAKGADQAFELGAYNSLFSYRANSYFTKYSQFKYNSEMLLKAEELASQVHPAWNKCDQYARKMHTRNVFQVLGHELDQPVKMLICWTRNGKAIGGTATSINLAKSLGIEVENLFEGE